MLPRCPKTAMVLMLQLGASVLLTNPSFAAAIFIINNDSVWLMDDPSQQVRLNQPVDLKSLGRTFHSARVGMEYEQGEEELVYYKVSKGGQDILISFSDSNRVSAISSSSMGVAFGKEGVVGGPARDVLGPRAFCNTYREDSPDYCMPSKNSNITFNIAWDENCKMPEQQEGIMTIPQCSRINEIMVFAPE